MADTTFKKDTSASLVYILRDLPVFSQLLLSISSEARVSRLREFC